MPVIKDKKIKGDSKYYYVINTGAGKNRKRIKKRGFKTIKEATAAMVEAQDAINKGTYIEPSKDLYETFILNRLNDKKLKIKDSTWSTYESLIRIHIIPGLGDLKLSSISPEDIQNFYNDLKLKKLCDGNIQKIHTLVNESLRKAANWSMIKINPAALLDRPQAQRKEMKIWTVDESLLYLKHAAAVRYYPAFLLALTTGMRQGEILGLTWPQVDFEANSITILQTLSHDGKKISPGTKTHTGIRVIAMDKETMAELKSIKNKIKEHKLAAGEYWEDHDLVVSTNVGTPLRSSDLCKVFHKTRIKAGLKHIRFHDLRHTHASTLLNKGFNVKVVAERLGHSVEVLMRTYAHLMPNMQKDMADQFGEIFSRNVKNEVLEENGTKLAPVVKMSDYV